MGLGARRDFGDRSGHRPFVRRRLLLVDRNDVGSDLRAPAGFAPEFIQRKAWRRPADAGTVSLVPSGGHDVLFAGRRIYPYKFLLKHYSIRSQRHGGKKVWRERKSRWNEGERAGAGTGTTARCARGTTSCGNTGAFVYTSAKVLLAPISSSD